MRFYKGLKGRMKVHVAQKQLLSVFNASRRISKNKKVHVPPVQVHTERS